MKTMSIILLACIVAATVHAATLRSKWNPPLIKSGNRFGRIRHSGQTNTSLLGRLGENKMSFSMPRRIIAASGDKPLPRMIDARVVRKGTSTMMIGANDKRMLIRVLKLNVKNCRIAAPPDITLIAWIVLGITLQIALWLGINFWRRGVNKALPHGRGI